MSVTTYANSSSRIKGLLVCLVFILILSGCAESGGPDDYGTGKPDKDNNIIAGAVIEIGDEWRYRKGTSALPSDWISVGFDDTLWLAGNSGIGYGDGDDETILSDMQGNYVTVYTRNILNYDGSVTINSLDLEIDYDDGFVAYINGQEVARANMPAGQPSFVTLASGARETGVADIINLDGFINLIGIGDNVIAIEIHNASLASSDLSFIPRLMVNMGASPPPSVSLSANPGSVVSSGSTMLSWNSTNATSCTASGNWSGSKGTSGSQTINALNANSTFNLSCNGPGGSASDSVSVTVSPPSAPLVNLSANPTNLPFNGSTTLSWSSSNTTGCTASGDWSGSKSTSGSQTINALTANSNFILSCSGNGGNANDSVSVTVAAPSAPVVNLSASPTNLTFNGSTTLSWSSSNATGCTASGDWSGSKSTSGSQTINALTANSNFVLSCTGNGGNANDSVSVTVAAPSAPVVNLSASPTNLTFNGSTTLSWTSSDTTSCTASGDWSGSMSTSGSQTINALTASSNFVLSCSGNGGNANDSVSVTVASPSAPVVNLSASPTNLTFNGSTTLSWSSSNATGCTASGDWSGSKSTSGSQTINALTANSNFVLSCSGNGGNANDSVSVTVTDPLPTVTFSANPTTVSQNDSTTLSWSSTDATSCTASGDWSGNRGTSGAETINSLTIDSQFTLTCSGAGGTANETVNVTVNNELPPPTGAILYDLYGTDTQNRGLIPFAVNWPAEPVTLGTLTVSDAASLAIALATPGVVITVNAGNYGTLALQNDDQVWLLDDNAVFSGLTATGRPSRVLINGGVINPGTGASISLIVDDFTMRNVNIPAVSMLAFGVGSTMSHRVALIHNTVIAQNYAFFTPGATASDVGAFGSDMIIAANYLQGGMAVGNSGVANALRVMSNHRTIIVDNRARTGFDGQGTRHTFRSHYGNRDYYMRRNMNEYGDGIYFQPRAGAGTILPNNYMGDHWVYDHVGYYNQNNLGIVNSQRSDGSVNTWPGRMVAVDNTAYRAVQTNPLGELDAPARWRWWPKAGDVIINNIEFPYQAPPAMNAWLAADGLPPGADH